MKHLLRSSVVVAALASCAAMLAGGCATTPERPQTMRDPQADFSTYRTFGWYRPPGDDGAAKPHSIVDGYVRTAIGNELTGKGYVEVAAGATPDLSVAYETASDEKLKSNPFRVGVGVGSFGRNVGGSVGVGSPGVRNVREGSLVVHAIDHARDIEIWRGSIARELGRGGVDAVTVQAAVSELMRDFPARGGDGPGNDGRQ
ncbi:MAG: DUF4136 domain-containing protein [Steroidobacteraceae bacterium]|nr:DUF4136 domain-containing protein [Steroidobacteraceae bacterium]